MAKSAEELLIYLFDEILPKHGMNLRVKQKELDRKSTRLNSSHSQQSRMPSSA